MYIPVPLQMLLNEFYKIVRAIRPRTCTRQPGVFRAGGYDLLLLSAAYLEADTVNGSMLCCRCHAQMQKLKRFGGMSLNWACKLRAMRLGTMLRSRS